MTHASAEKLLWMYETMLVIRRYEETMAQVIRSIASTGRLLVADEDYLNFGLSGEIAAIVAERLDGVALKAPVRRLGVPGVPIPYSRPLELSVIPSVLRIVEASRRLMDSRLKTATWPVAT